MEIFMLRLNASATKGAHSWLRYITREQYHQRSTIYDQDLPNKPTELSNPINSRTTESLNFAMEDEKPKGFVLF
ncbi:hypothetical protein L2E82_02411 [Cichorium intybus]|uniref:Uncharacterized protein n=1 Tax=Cichorium intybus TaxID=13427 RepID=A0ACB9H2W1_CICIN|nr:hypothetical protein L2E82_02411 [Cichorium intybus]